MIDDVTNKLVECGYKQQAQPSLINLFYETDGLRKKIDYTDGNFVVDGITFSKYEMHQLADKSPERFLPKVLLRPIFQDFALPTAVYIGGPGEIAYLCQLKDMYDYFGITMPVVAGRHSITLLNNFAIRNLEKSGLNAEYFFQHFSIIEKELSVKLFNNELESAFFESENLITSGYNSLKEILNSIDKTLETNLSISLNKSLEQLLNLKKKTISQLKRKNDSEIIRLRKLSNFLFPNNIPQERVMSIFNFLAQYKSNTIIETIQDITNLTNNLHYIADLDKEFTI